MGIAAIGLFLEHERYHYRAMSALIGSAIYLLAESGQRDRRHELYNLSRIMDVLLAARPPIDGGARRTRWRRIISRPVAWLRDGGRDRHQERTSEADLDDGYRRLCDAIEKAREGGPEKERGLTVPPDDLRRWGKSLGCIARHASSTSG